MTDDEKVRRELLAERFNAIVKPQKPVMEAMFADHVYAPYLAAMSSYATLIQSQERERAATHKTDLGFGGEYYSPKCSCGWQGGCWASYENARSEVWGHEEAVRKHMPPFGQAAIRSSFPTQEGGAKPRGLAYIFARVIGTIEAIAPPYASTKSEGAEWMRDQCLHRLGRLQKEMEKMDE